jgi:hypothetical protein
MNALVEAARKDLGKKEKPGNGGWYDQYLEKDMKADGWSKGMAWCAFIVEKWAEQAYPNQEKKLDKLFSGSAVLTFKNFQKAGYKISKTPVLGSIVIWQKYQGGVPHWSGHAGIVSEVISDREFTSIEGNTNAAGGREGNVVAEKHRKIVKLDTGLNVLGFIIIE